MVGLVISIIVEVALAALFIWLAIRAWRSRHALVKWLGVVLAGLFGLVFTAVTVVTLMGVYKENVPPYAYGNGAVGVPVTGSADPAARGQQIAVLCAGCHSSTGELPLDGSKDNFAAGGPPLGVLYAPNLTPSGPLKDWTDAEIMRAIREGVDNQGHPLIIMPSDGFHGMNDEDARSVVAYLRSQPPSARNVPPKNLSVLGYALIGAGLFPTSAQPPISGPIAGQPRGATAEYGRYITKAFACTSCHGTNLTGGVPGGGPAGPNLTAIVPHWSQADFITMFRTGVAPGGVQINPDYMPWKEYSRFFSDEDLQALYLYLHSLTPVNNPGK